MSLMICMKHFSNLTGFHRFLFAAYFVFLATVQWIFLKQKHANKILESFSVTKNFAEIFEIKSSNEISILNGIRFINIIFVFLCHKTNFIDYNPYMNKSYFDELSSSIISYPFRAAYIYTDVFLMLSGFLLSHSLIGRLQKRVKISLMNEIVGRYIRMVPALVTVLLFSTYILPHLGSGPQWNVISDQAEVCRPIWWRNIFMLHNWFGNQCLPQTHHVGTDFTLFLFSLPLIIFLHKQPTAGIVAISLLALMSAIARFYVTFNYDLVIYLFHGVS